MRYSRVIGVLLILAACKTANVKTSSIEIEEDLSLYRPELESTTTTQTIESENTDSLQYEVEIDPKYNIKDEIDSINRIVIERNSTNTTMAGFSIQIYRGNSREEAERLQNDANTIFPELESSLSYYQPTYRVKIGKFIDRLTASKYFKDVQQEFSRAILVPDQVNLIEEKDGDN